MKGNKRTYYLRYLRSAQLETDFFNKIIRAFKTVNNRVEEQVNKVEYNYDGPHHWNWSHLKTVSQKLEQSEGCVTGAFFSENHDKVKDIVVAKLTPLVKNVPKHFYGGGDVVLSTKYFMNAWGWPYEEANPLGNLENKVVDDFGIFNFSVEPRPYWVAGSWAPNPLDTNRVSIGDIIKAPHDFIDATISEPTTSLLSIDNKVMEGLKILKDELSKDHDRVVRKLGKAVNERLKQYEGTGSVYYLLSIFNLIGQFQKSFENVRLVVVSWKIFKPFFSSTQIRDIRYWFRNVIRFLFKNMEDSADHAIVFLTKEQIFFDHLMHYSHATTFRIRRNIYTTG